MTGMPRTSIAAVALACAMGGGPAFADGGADSSCHAPNAKVVKLMVKTTVILVPDYRGLPSEYQPDVDLDTLELVEMPAAEGTSSSVSEDGQVIFLVGDSKDAERGKLIELAFCRRVVAGRT